MGAGTASIDRLSEGPPAPLPTARPTDRLVVGGLAALGAACVSTVFFGGLYDVTDWWPVAVVTLAGAIAAAVAVRPLAPTRLATVALGSLVALAAWAMLSTLWAEWVDQALVGAARWAFYAGAFLVLVALVRGERRARAVLVGATAATVVVGVWVVIRMQAGDAASIFLEGRLNAPLEYVNGQAALFLLGFWPLVAVAEHGRRALVSGAAAAGAAGLAGLMVLSQSRGVVLGLVASVVLVLALVPGRLRRVALLGLLVVVVVGLGGPLRHVYDSSGGGDHAPATSAIHDAGLWVLVLAAVTGVVWGGARATLDALAPAGSAARATARSVALGALLVFAVGALGVGIVKAGTISTKLSDQYDAFVHLKGNGRSQRLLSGGGDRYDYWRIALREAGDHPLAGVGAGNYAIDYFRERHNDLPVTQPHSLPFQVLAELGVVGALLFLGFVGALFVGLWRFGRRVASRMAPADLCIAAGGIVVGFLAQSCVDWVWLIPTLMGVFLFGAVALVGCWVDPGRRPFSGWMRWALVGAVVLGAGFAAFTAGRVSVAESDRRDAAALLNRDPRAALTKAHDALDLNGDSITARFTEAAALARLNQYDAARSVLLGATRLQPHNYAPWALLGDLALARGDLSLARDAYRRALALNPRDASLQQLARNPRASVSGG
jgi:O-Antigen ligase